MRSVGSWAEASCSQHLLDFAEFGTQISAQWNQLPRRCGLCTQCCKIHRTVPCQCSNGVLGYTTGSGLNLYDYMTKNHVMNHDRTLEVFSSNNSCFPSHKSNIERLLICSLCSTGLPHIRWSVSSLGTQDNGTVVQDTIGSVQSRAAETSASKPGSRISKRQHQRYLWVDDFNSWLEPDRVPKNISATVGTWPRWVQM